MNSPPKWTSLDIEYDLVFDPRCCECGRVSDQGPAYLVMLDPDDPQRMLPITCPCFPVRSAFCGCELYDLNETLPELILMLFSDQLAFNSGTQLEACGFFLTNKTCCGSEVTITTEALISWLRAHSPPIHFMELRKYLAESFESSLIDPINQEIILNILDELHGECDGNMKPAK